jgi:hypothetical protein
MKDNKLLHNGKIVVPEEEIEDILTRVFEDHLYMQISPHRF